MATGSGDLPAGRDPAVPSNPLALFRAEHRAALEMLDRLDRAAAALESGQISDQLTATVRDVHRFLTTEVRRHNEDEEGTLVDLLGDEAPLEYFAEEHRTLRRLEEELLRALDSDDPRGRVPRVARTIAQLLRAHIAREEEVLFPMAQAWLGDEGLAIVARRLERSRSQSRSGS